MTRQQKKERLIKSYNAFIKLFFAYLAWCKKHGTRTADKGNNEDQPRDKKTGKFVKAGTSIEITGNEFDNYKHLSSVKARAKQYYKDNLSGTSFEDKDIGQVYFGKKLVGEIIHKARGNKDVLHTIPYLSNLVNTGEKQPIQGLTHERSDEFKNFLPIKNKIKIKGKIYKVKIKIGIKNYNKSNERKEVYVAMMGGAKKEKQKKKKTSDTVVVSLPQPQKRGRRSCTRVAGYRSSSMPPVNDSIYYEIIDVNII